MDVDAVKCDSNDDVMQMHSKGDRWIECYPMRIGSGRTNSTGGGRIITASLRIDDQRNRCTQNTILSQRY